MLEFRIPSTLCTVGLYSQRESTHEGTHRVSIYTVPFSHQEDRKLVRVGSIRQDDLGIGSEKPVIHSKRSGCLSLLNPQVTRWRPASTDSRISPQQLEIYDGKKWTVVGNYHVPVEGTLSIRLKRSNGYPLEFHAFSTLNRVVLHRIEVFTDKVLVSTYTTYFKERRKFYRRHSESSTTYPRDIPIRDIVSNAKTAFDSMRVEDIPTGWLPVTSHTENHVGRTAVERAIRYYSSNVGRAPITKEARSLTFAQLMQRAVEDLDTLNLNGLMYVQEMAKIRSLLPPMSDLRRLENPKSWANIYLWFRYGVMLSWRDTKQLLTSLSSLRKPPEKKTRLRARSSNTIEDKEGNRWQVTQVVRVLCDTYPKSLAKVGRVIDRLYDLDLMPTLGNLWDMIPYSFVLDWVLPIQDFLDRLDYHGRLQSFTIHSVTTSEKHTCSFTPSRVGEINVCGTYTDTYYRRRVSRTIPLVGIFDGFESPTKPGFRRFVDGTALTVQRLS